MTKVTTVRLDDKTYTQLEAIAAVQDVSVSEVMREAAAAHIQKHVDDPEFADKVRAVVEMRRQEAEQLGEAFDP